MTNDKNYGKIENYCLVKIIFLVKFKCSKSLLTGGPSRIIATPFEWCTVAKNWRVKSTVKKGKLCSLPRRFSARARNVKSQNNVLSSLRRRKKKNRSRKTQFKHFGQGANFTEVLRLILWRKSVFISWTKLCRFSIFSWIVLRVFVFTEPLLYMYKPFN